MYWIVLESMKKIPLHHFCKSEILFLAHVRKLNMGNEPSEIKPQKSIIVWEIKPFLLKYEILFVGFFLSCGFLLPKTHARTSKWTVKGVGNELIDGYGYLNGCPKTLLRGEFEDISRFVALKNLIIWWSFFDFKIFFALSWEVIR